MDIVKVERILNAPNCECAIGMREMTIMGQLIYLGFGRPNTKTKESTDMDVTPHGREKRMDGKLKIPDLFTPNFGKNMVGENNYK